jgi:predicted Zn-dependent protease
MRYLVCSILLFLTSCGGSKHLDTASKEHTIIPVENGKIHSEQCTALFARNNIDLICQDVEKCNGFPCLHITNEDLGLNREGNRVVGICYSTGLIKVTTYKRTDEEIVETMAHEIGHLFGLPHHTECDNIMTPDMICRDVRTNFTEAQREYFP